MELRFSFKNGHRKRLGQQRSPDHREHTIVRLLACTSKQCDLSNVRICESGKDSAVHAASRLKCGAIPCGGTKEDEAVRRGCTPQREHEVRLSTSNECICCSVGTALVKPATACHASPSSCGRLQRAQLGPEQPLQASTECTHAATTSSCLAPRGRIT